MTKRKETRPAWNRRNMEPTLNGTGFMFKVLDEYAEDFIQYAGQTDGEVLEIGCAFGITTIAALKAGGHVTACDLDPGHLQILTENTPKSLRSQLTCITPYGIWRKLIPIFEARRVRSDRWPGLMIGLENYLPFSPKDRAIDAPPFMNLLDPELLTRICTDAGFEVEQAGFIDRSDFSGLGRMDGRENAGIRAIRAN